MYLVPVTCLLYQSRSLRGLDNTLRDFLMKVLYTNVYIVKVRVREPMGNAESPICASFRSEGAKSGSSNMEPK